MYSTKKLAKTGDTVMAYQSTWLVEETFSCNELILRPRALLIAPEGKFLTLTVDGVGRKILPGVYKGDVVLSVTDGYHMRPGGLMCYNEISRDFHTAIVVENGKVIRTIPAILQGGVVADDRTEGVYMASREDCFNGIVIDGDGKYLVKNVTANFDGFGDNDFLGVGCAVTAVGTSDVTIEDCDFTVNGVTRCAVHAGDHCRMLVKNTRIVNTCPEDQWPGSFSWQLAFFGGCRLTQMSDSASVVYDGCELRSNGWGVMSIDGWDGGQLLTIKNSKVVLSGPKSHGYGVFCIGDNEVVYDNCDVDVYGYPLLLFGQMGKAKASILGSRITGRRFGAMINCDDNSLLTIRDSSFKTGKSTFCMKGSSTVVDIKNTVMEPQNGVVLQLMDSDEAGMNSQNFFVPVGEVDVPIVGRDLASVSPTEDVTFRLEDCHVVGSFLNSTSNIRAFDRCERGGFGEFHDTVIGLLPMADEANGDSYGNTIAGRHKGDDLRGPKNLSLELKNSSVEGVVSSAVQQYRDGVKVIVEDNRMELSNITQTAAPTVNNGVVLTLDGGSSWIVTGTSYITGLVLAEGAQVKAPAGRRLSVTLDGEPVELKAGRCVGRIVLSVE